LLNTGIAALMRPPQGKTLIYTVAVVVCLFVVWIVIFGVIGAIFGMGLWMR
jgi:hypothetical protein